MYSKVSELSNFLVGLQAQARSLSAAELIDHAVAKLADTLGYDSAWYGWAQVDPATTIIHANDTFNLPEGYFDFWVGMADQDLLVEQFRKDRRSIATYDRFGDAQTDGMEHLADVYGISKMTTAVAWRDGRTASFFLSAYRGGKRADGWRKEEREFLQCAVENISAIASTAARHDLRSADGQTASAYFSKEGATIIGLEGLRNRFGHLWTRKDGDRLPRWLADYVNEPGEYILPDEELVVQCEPAAHHGAMGWQKLSLRPLQKVDLLSPREREVARALANGMSHKTVAKVLGIAPATVRNQTQAIYRKLGVDNRASLARHVFPQIGA